MKSSKIPNEPRRYAIESSPLFRLSNKKKLAALLDVEVSAIRDLDKSGLDQQYRFFVDKKSCRFITEPIDTLAKIHRQLLKFLVRIAPPDYIHSAIKRRSYKTNAYAHRNGGGVVKVDIKKFFPSVKFDCIYKFFSESLQCSPDINDGVLPNGLHRTNGSKGRQAVKHFKPLPLSPTSQSETPPSESLPNRAAPIAFQEATTTELSWD